MLGSIPIKRSYLLAGAAIVLTLLSIRFAFWNTLQAWKINKQLTDQLAKASDVSYQPGYLERKNKNLDKILSRFMVDTSNYRGILLSAISSLAEQKNVKVVSVPDGSSTPYYKTRHFTIQKIEVEGSYADLTRFYHQLETSLAIGKVRAAQYILFNQRTRNGNERTLKLYIYLERSR